MIVRCGVCGMAVEVITKTHLKKHGITREQYLRKFPEHAADAFWPTTRRHGGRGKDRSMAAAAMD